METEEAKMKNRKTTLKIFLATLLVVALLATGAANAAEPTKTFETLEDRIEYLELMVKYIEYKYKYDVTEDELMEGAYTGLFDVLDEHSSYFSPDEYDRFNEEATKEYEGIGIHMTKRGEHTVVISPIEGTPAAEAGIMAGDIIRYVDGEDITGYALDKAASLIRGEEGTLVNIGIIRNGISETVYLDITRKSIVVNEITSEILDGNIGYIKISRFSSETDSNFGEIIEDFNEKGIQGLVIDLRNNPGGLVQESVKLADRFIEEGDAIVHLDYRNEDERETYMAHNGAMDIPLAVLINEGSASASEIFAGAIKDTGSGIIVGTKSFGKGTVQNVSPISNGGAIKLTIAEYLTAGEEKIDKVGIQPDIVVENPKTNQLEEVKDFVPMIEADKPALGDIGLNVYGAQQRLAFLGYDVTPSGKMDGNTFEMIRRFQESEGLYPYGVLDWTTRDRLMNKVYDIVVTGTEDLQLQTAIDKIK